MQESVMCIDGKSHDSLDNLTCYMCGRKLLEIRDSIIKRVQSQDTNNIRCTKCNKMLAEWKGRFYGEGKEVVLEIKCPRCKTLNEVVV